MKRSDPKLEINPTNEVGCHETEGMWRWIDTAQYRSKDKTERVPRIPCYVGRFCASFINACLWCRAETGGTTPSRARLRVWHIRCLRVGTKRSFLRPCNSSTLRVLEELCTMYLMYQPYADVPKLNSETPTPERGSLDEAEFASKLVK